MGLTGLWWVAPREEYAKETGCFLSNAISEGFAYAETLGFSQWVVISERQNVHCNEGTPSTSDRNDPTCVIVCAKAVSEAWLIVATNSAYESVERMSIVVCRDEMIHKPLQHMTRLFLIDLLCESSSTLYTGLRSLHECKHLKTRIICSCQV